MAQPNQTWHQHQQHYQSHHQHPGLMHHQPQPIVVSSLLSNTSYSNHTYIERSDPPTKQRCSIGAIQVNPSLIKLIRRLQRQCRKINQLLYPAVSFVGSPGDHQRHQRFHHESSGPPIHLPLCHGRHSQKCPR